MSIYGSFNTQPPEGGWVSCLLRANKRMSFNTQPPEGGWGRLRPPAGGAGCFNTQPPEGGWTNLRCRSALKPCFNTQPPEGGWGNNQPHQFVIGVSTHSRLKAAGTGRRNAAVPERVSTHSRLKAAGSLHLSTRGNTLCFNTQPPEGGWGSIGGNNHGQETFQHTAA